MSDKYVFCEHCKHVFQMDADSHINECPLCDKPNKMPEVPECVASELARRDEIIKRFEKVVEYIIQEAFETEIILWGTDEGEVIAERYNKIVNRALMKELEEK